MQINRNVITIKNSDHRKLVIVNPDTGHVLMSAENRCTVFNAFNELDLEEQGYRIMTFRRMKTITNKKFDDLEYAYKIEPKVKLLPDVSNKYLLSQFPIY